MAGPNQHTQPGGHSSDRQRWYRNRALQASVSAAVVAGLFTLAAALVSRRSPPPTPPATMQSRPTDDSSYSSEWMGRFVYEHRPLFAQGDVLPSGFETFGLGTRVSVLQSVFPRPQGTLLRTRFELLVRDGPFDRVWYNHDGGKDPAVTSIVFWFRTPVAKTLVWRDALGAFRDFPYLIRVLGTVLEFPDVNGFRIVLDDDNYQIHRARP